MFFFSPNRISFSRSFKKIWWIWLAFYCLLLLTSDFFEINVSTQWRLERIWCPGQTSHVMPTPLEKMLLRYWVVTVKWVVESYMFSYNRSFNCLSENFIGLVPLWKQCRLPNDTFEDVDFFNLYFNSDHAQRIMTAKIIWVIDTSELYEYFVIVFYSNGRLT